MANESFSFEEAIGLTQKPQPSGAADPGGFSFEEALGKPAQASPGFIPTIKRTGGQMLTTAATAAEDVVGPNAVTRAVHDTGQGIINRNPAGIRSLRDLVDSPWLAVKESVGQFAPQIAAAAVAEPINRTGQPLQLNMAHALRAQADQAGMQAAVVRHASGRGYDVVPRLPAPAVVAAPGGAPFSTPAAAQAELQRQQLGATHELAPAGGDSSLGFVLQKKGTSADSAPAAQAQTAINSGVNRAINWRSNALQANRVARDQGIDPKGNMISSGTRGERSGMRAELRDAFAELMRTMSRKAEQYLEDTAKADQFVASARADVQQRLDGIRADLARQLDERYVKRNNKPATAEQLTDKSGIVVQDEVDAAALWGQAAGFSPSSVRNSYEGKSAIVGHDRALQARRSALVEQFAVAAMAKDEEGKAEAREDIARFNEKNPTRRIQPMQLAQSVAMRQKRIREAQEGVYLPAKRRDALEAGRFATGD